MILPTPEEWTAWLDRLRATELILVEGVKDVRSLADLGITATPLRGPLHEVIDRASAKNCVLLTDLDTEGKRLHGMLKEQLTRNGVIVDDNAREFLFRTPVRHIEGLATYLRGRVDKTIAKNESSFACPD